MGKIDIEFRTKSSQSTIGCVKQGVCGKIIHRSEPFALEYSPQSLSDTQMRTVRWKKEDEQASLFPYRAKFLHEFTPVYAGIVKHHECIPADTHRQSVQKVRDFVSRHVLGCGEPSYLLFRSIIPKILSLSPLSDGIYTSSQRNCQPYGT